MKQWKDDGIYTLQASSRQGRYCAAFYSAVWMTKSTASLTGDDNLKKVMQL